VARWPIRRAKSATYARRKFDGFQGEVGYVRTPKIRRLRSRLAQHLFIHEQAVKETVYLSRVHASAVRVISGWQLLEDKTRVDPVLISRRNCLRSHFFFHAGQTVQDISTNRTCKKRFQDQARRKRFAPVPWK